MKFSVANLRSIRTPPFFWQGVLILLPALLMAGFGIYSLRQDRVLARHEAAVEAEQWATNVLTQLQAAVSKAVPATSASNFPLASDPLESFHEQTDGGWLWWVHSNSLIYPPPLGDWPAPAPLEHSRLSAEQSNLWFRLESPEPFGGTNDTILSNREQRALPERHAAVARYRQSRGLLKDGEEEEALKPFIALLHEPLDLREESGIPVAVLSALQIAKAGSADARDRDRAMRILGEYAARNPSYLSRYLLWKGEHYYEQRMGTAYAEAANWNSVLSLHQQARTLFPKLPAGENQWIQIGEEERHWLFRRDTSTGSWMYTWPSRSLQDTAMQIASSAPVPYLEPSVSIADATIYLPAKAGLESVDTLHTLEAKADSQIPWSIDILLVQPEMVYSRQRTRTYLYGSLIALSIGAVIAGFVTAYRSFHRQRQLSEMKSNFVSSVSHELRAPIASIRLMSEELEEVGAIDRKKSKQYHAFINQECRRLTHLIENVLDFSRHERGVRKYEFEPMDLLVLVEETVRLMNPFAAEHDIRIETRVEGKEFQIEADGRALQQVLVNLLDNAIKHSPAHGVIQVQLRRQPDSTSFQLLVRDQGPGIPAEDHMRIFQTFYRRGSELRRETQGIGLGLTIVRYIVRVHGGTVHVESAPGQGSAFIVSLPPKPPPSTNH